MATFQELLADQAQLDEQTSKAFDLIDWDKSGQLKKSDLKTGLNIFAQDFGLPLPSQEHFLELLSALGTDLSDSLSKEEFKVLLIQLLPALAQA
jgi:Ca2+-binding EF-hand superfamily protein